MIYILAMDGLNKSIYEIGSDSAFSIMARSFQLIKEGKDVINLGIGQPDFPTPKNIVESAIKALEMVIMVIPLLMES